MSTINIENLSFDDKVDREAMNAITGGWGFSSIYKSCVRYPKARFSDIKKAYRTSRRIVRAIRSWF
jgi:hypothetical protein